MNKLATTGTLGLAGLVTTGLFTFQAQSAATAEDDQFLKRDDDTPDVVMTVDDDDDNDTFRRDGTNTNDTTRNTGVSRSTNDGTNSRFTRVSRDRDLSRSDKTRDWTDDGPGRDNRDWSANHTNDGSRNDTRR